MVTTYFYCAWQHNRYWDGTMKRVNEIETSVYEKLLGPNIAEQSQKNDFNKLSEIFAPLNGKLLIRVQDENGEAIFTNKSGNRRLGHLLLRTEYNIGTKKYLVEFVRYKPPNWNQEFLDWLSRPGEWLKITYDRITMPFLFFFVIWTLFFASVIWYYKARLESERLFSVLREFETESDEEELENFSPKC